MWTTLNFNGKSKMKKERNGDICKGTLLDIEFERDWSFGLSAAAFAQDFFFFFSFSDFSGNANSVTLLGFVAL